MSACSNTVESMPPENATSQRAGEEPAVSACSLSLSAVESKAIGAEFVWRAACGRSGFPELTETVDASLPLDEQFIHAQLVDVGQML